MCDCINQLEEKGFVKRESVYENQDFIDKGYLLRKYAQVKGKVATTNQFFKINYCPACGERVRVEK